MSKLKIIFNFNDTPEKEPVELGEWLQVQKNQDDIYNMRCLYLLRPNMENELTKLGIAGENGGTGAYGRLRQYVLEYGFEQPGFNCHGVKMFLLVGVKYNKDVDIKNSFVFKKELQLIREFKGDRLPGRGRERIMTDLAKVYEVVFDNSTMTSLEKETKLRKSLRIQQSDIQVDDWVLNVTKHVTPKKGTGKTVFYTEFTRPYIDEKTNQKTKKKETTLTFHTNETYENLENIPNGKTQVDRYIISKKATDPKVVFRL